MSKDRKIPDGVKRVLYIDPTQEGKEEISRCLTNAGIFVDLCDDVLNAMMKTSTGKYDMVIAAQDQKVYEPSDIAHFMQEQNIPYIIIARDELSPMILDKETQLLIVPGPANNTAFTSQIKKIGPSLKQVVAHE